MENRIEALKREFKREFGAESQGIYSAPGRTELGGNHTDHQHGLVLAAAVNMDMLAAVRKNGTNSINIKSEGYEKFSIDLNDLSAREQEKGSSVALVRGICSEISAQGYELGGFDAYITSRVMRGSGLSSSAAFEVLIGGIINQLFCGETIDNTGLAVIGQRAENLHFGKPCGLMDQMAAAWGGIIGIDFKGQEPEVEQIDFDFGKTGYGLCLIDVGADHANLTEEYANIPKELGKVAEFFGKSYLREVDEKELYSSIRELRKAAGDRAILRAIHIFEENKRVKMMKTALKENDFGRFMELVNESGRSSWMYLQNVIVQGSTAEQAAALALSLCENLVGHQVACRVHGGGFGGTVQCYVEKGELPEFKNRIEEVFGEGHCHVMEIRKEGFIQVE